MRTPFPLGSRELASGAETAASRSAIRCQQLPLVKMLHQQFQSTLGLDRPPRRESARRALYPRGKCSLRRPFRSLLSASLTGAPSAARGPQLFWPVPPRCGLHAETAVLSAAESGRTSCCTYLLAKQVHGWDADDLDIRQEGLVFKLRGPFRDHVGPTLRGWRPPQGLCRTELGRRFRVRRPAAFA